MDCTALLRKKTKKERCIVKRITTVLVVLVLAVAALGNQRVPKVEFIKGKNKIDVMIGGKHFTSYIYGNELTKPMMVPRDCLRRDEDEGANGETIQEVCEIMY